MECETGGNDVISLGTRVIDSELKTSTRMRRTQLKSRLERCGHFPALDHWVIRAVEAINARDRLVVRIYSTELSCVSFGHWRHDDA